MEGFEGETVIAVRFDPALLTVRTADPKKLPELALTVMTPVATPVATPTELTETIFVSDELQLTEAVRSLLDPSEYEPVA